MIETLLEYDQILFRLINGVWIHPVADAILTYARNKFIWLPLYMFILSFLIINFRVKGLIYFLGILVVVGFCDQLSSNFLKPLVDRDRPCDNPELEEYVRTLIDCGGRSFPSSHATNHFGIAAFLSMLFGRIFRPIYAVAFAWALVISYAQVYVGVHYPLDVFVGGLLGTLLGLFVFWLVKQLLKMKGVEEVP